LRGRRIEKSILLLDEKPDTYAASFLGESNFFDGVVVWPGGGHGGVSSRRELRRRIAVPAHPRSPRLERAKIDAMLLIVPFIFREEREP